MSKSGVTIQRLDTFHVMIAKTAAAPAISMIDSQIPSPTAWSPFGAEFNHPEQIGDHYCTQPTGYRGILVTHHR
jgi:hypothetical protein